MVREAKGKIFFEKGGAVILYIHFFILYIKPLFTMYNVFFNLKYKYI